MQRLRLSRLQLYGLASTACFVSAIVNAFRVRSNFYSAAVYLSKSNACMMIIWNQGIYQTVLLGKLVQAIFFGELRMIEVERLQERAWFAVTETLLALTIFKDDFESSFVMLFVSLLFLKVFHWLASDRVEMMEQSAQVPRLAHVRMVTLLGILWIVDVLFVVLAVESILIDGPTVMVMFASEYLILLASLWSITAKYVICCIDLRSDAPWESKSLYGLYVDLVADFLKLVTYLIFFTLILTFYGLPLNILRDVYLTIRSFVLKCRDLGRYRAATRNMETLYPDATLAEMDAMADKTCIICREDMEFRGERPAAAEAEDRQQDRPNPPPRPPPTGLNDTPKKLPCGHVFHFHCLKSWLERQQSCPTCRRPVLQSERARPARQVAAADIRGAGVDVTGNAHGHRHNDGLRQAHINLARNLGRDAFGVVFPGIPYPAEADQPVPGVANEEAASSSTPAGPSSPRPTTNDVPPSASLARSQPPTLGTDNPLARFALPHMPLPPLSQARFHGTRPLDNLAEQFGSLATGSQSWELPKLASKQESRTSIGRTAIPPTPIQRDQSQPGEPRLIPLLDAPDLISAGLALSDAPSLPTKSLLPPSSQALSDEERQNLLTTADRGLHRRLQLLVDYQERIDSLVSDMQTDLDSLKRATYESTSARNKGKGKEAGQGEGFAFAE
ncbi:E3 ubiquitin-protein ligase hrd1 [Microbotryomycetes sp. JL201]|nr:E3 ubiquitin-protein ligase hrd1 [Microbotryomycetes sp. JL201]